MVSYELYNSKKFRGQLVGINSLNRYNLLNLHIPEDQIKSFCSRWKIDQFALFGSILRNDFKDKSDIDVLVTFKKNAEWSLFDQVDMKDELQAIFGRPVDLVSRRGIEGSRNHLRRQEILNSAKVIYGVS